MGERLVSAEEARVLRNNAPWGLEVGDVFDLAATVEALHAEVADLRRQLAEARDAERDAVVAWLVQRAPGEGLVEDVWWDIADAVSENVHRVTP